MPYIPYLPYIGNIPYPSIVTILTIHTIQTIHTVISNIPYPTDLHTILTIHTITTIHAIHSIHSIPTIHTILSKHAIPDRPYTPYIPNIPYHTTLPPHHRGFHTPTTPQGGRGKISYGGSIWDPSHGGGEGGVAGPGAYILHHYCISISTDKNGGLLRCVRQARPQGESGSRTARHVKGRAGGMYICISII